jgi:single-strand selective monofunctional uracil DNA glycosylase
MATTAAERVLRESEALTDALRRLRFSPPVAAVYNPISYAFPSWRAYHQRYAHDGCRVLLLGMNPGPWGMAQTGVPFGEIAAVREWMGIEEPIGRPENEHPARPIEGFACTRSEVSGRRLWGLMKERFGTAERFFEEHFVANYCPLVFMGESGKNITPDKLPADERAPLFKLCDDFLVSVVHSLEPDYLVAVGKFALGRAETALSQVKNHPETLSVLHPSPASPAANKDWAGAATRALIEAGVWKG